MIAPRDRGSPWALRRARVVEQGLVYGHAVLDREQRAEPGHRVGRRAQSGVAVGLRAPTPFGDGRGLEPADEVVELADELAVADRVDLGEVTCDLLVDGAPMLGGHAGGLALDQAGLPLADPACPQQREGVGQLVAQRSGEAHLPLPAVW